MKIQIAAAAVIVLLLAGCGGQADEESAGDLGTESSALCTSVNGVRVTTLLSGQYYYSAKMTTTGCTVTFPGTISAAVAGGCAYLRVRLFPSAGGEIVPRDWAWVCTGMQELANYVAVGTKYRIESQTSATVNVQH